MNNKVKMCSCTLAGIMIGSLTIVGANQTIQAIQNTGIKVSINGQVQEFKDESTGEVQYPITYNNRTYLPLRNIANLAGYSVNYNSKINEAELSKSYSDILNDILKTEGGEGYFDSIKRFYLKDDQGEIQGVYYYLKSLYECWVCDNKGNKIDCLEEGVHSGPSALYVPEDGEPYYYVDEYLEEKNDYIFTKYYLRYDNGNIISVKDNSKEYDYEIELNNKTHNLNMVQKSNELIIQLDDDIKSTFKINLAFIPDTLKEPKIATIKDNNNIDYLVCIFDSEDYNTCDVTYFVFIDENGNVIDRYSRYNGTGITLIDNYETISGKNTINADSIEFYMYKDNKVGKYKLFIKDRKANLELIETIESNKVSLAGEV